MASRDCGLISPDTWNTHVLGPVPSRQNRREPLHLSPLQVPPWSSRFTTSYTFGAPPALPLPPAVAAPAPCASGKAGRASPCASLCAPGLEASAVVNFCTSDWARVIPSKDRTIKLYVVAAVKPFRTIKCDLVFVGSQHGVNVKVGDPLAM